MPNPAREVPFVAPASSGIPRPQGHVPSVCSGDFTSPCLLACRGTPAWRTTAASTKLEFAWSPPAVHAGFIYLSGMGGGIADVEDSKSSGDFSSCRLVLPSPAPFTPPSRLPPLPLRKTCPSPKYRTNRRWTLILVDGAAVADGHDQHDELGLPELANDSIVAHAISP